MAQFPEVGVKLVADGAGKYIADIGRAEGATSGLGRSISGAAGVMGGFGQSLSRVGGLLTGGIALGIGALGAGFAAFATTGVNAAIDLEHQMSAIAAVLKITKDEAQPLQDLIGDLALNPQLTVTTQQAADAIEMLARNGLDMTQIMDGAAEAVVALSNATGGEFAQSADVMTDAMAQFNIEAGDLEQVIDGITGVVNNSKFTMNDFALALAQGGGVAATVGVEFDDFTTTIAAISPLFASGSDAGTSFKTMLLRLVPASDPAAEAMKELGIITEDGSNAFFDAEGNLKSMAEISGVLNGALEGLTEEQKNNYLATIFGTDAMRAAAGIAGLTAEEFTELSENVNLSGQAFQSAATRVDNVKGAIDILGGIFEALGIQLGQKLLPYIRAFVDQAIIIADVYGGVAIEAVSSFMDSIAALIANMQEGMSPLDAFIEAIWNIAPASVLDGLIAVRDLIPVLGGYFETYLQPIVDFVAQNVQLSDVMIALGIAIGAFVLPIIGSLIVSLGTLLAPILLVIGAVALVRTAWEQNWGGVQEKTAVVFAFLSENIPVWMATIQEVVNTVLAAIAQFWSTYGDQIMTIATNVWTIIQSVITSVVAVIGFLVLGFLEKIQTAWQTYGDQLMSIATVIWEGILNTIEGVTNVILGIIGVFTGLITGDFDTLKAGLEQIVTGTWQTIEAIFTDFIPAIIDIAAIFVEDIVSTFAGKDWGQVGGDIVRGIGDGLSALAGWLASKASEMATAALNAAKAALGIESPSKEFMKVGINVGEGMAMGIEAMTGAVAGSASGLAEAALSPVSSPSQISNITNNRNTTVNFTGNYSSAPQVTDSASLARVMAGYA